MWPTPGCRRGWGAGRLLCPRPFLPDPLGGPPHLNWDHAAEQAEGTQSTWWAGPPTGQSGPSCPPSSPFVFPTSSTGRAVVGYIPEGRLMTAGEDQPGSGAPEASGQRGEWGMGGRGLPWRGRMRACGRRGPHGPKAE